MIFLGKVLFIFSQYYVINIERSVIDIVIPIVIN